MLIAGIAWSGDGLDVAFRTASGAPGPPAAHFPAGHLADLTAQLRELGAQQGQGLLCVVDSTNGMVDGGLLAAGLRVHRADPWTLPDRPAFGSVGADDLARAAVSRLSALARLSPAEGSLTGRSEDHARAERQARDALAALARAGRCVAHGPRDGDTPCVALTFDDGPNPPWTGRILDVLDRFGIPATFFCVGMHATGHPEELARMADAGHGFGNHTWSHPYLPDLSRPEIERQLARTGAAVARGAGVAEPRLFRPPYGSGPPELYAWLGADQAATTVALWDVDPGDWAMPGSEAIAASVLEQTRPGSIVLLHDGGGDRSQTVEALPSVIEGLLARGYRFVLVDELLRHAGSTARGTSARTDC